MIVFITNSVWDGNLGGVLGANTKCQNEWNASHPSSYSSDRSFKAWISDSATQPSDSSYFTHSTLPYKQMDGGHTQIASNWTNLISSTMLAGTFIYKINGSSAGSYHYAWTATTGGGDRISTSNFCSNWTDNVSPSIRVGGVGEGGDYWTYYGITGCVNLNIHLYCFQQ
jgi:hypothetical protein